MHHKSLLLLPLFILAWLFTSSSFAREGASLNSQPESVKVDDIIINSLIAYPEDGVTADNIQETLRQARSEQGEKLSIEALYSIADKLTKVYRQAGFKFHSVFVPPQKISAANSLRLELLEAKIGDIQVSGEDENLNRVIKVLFERYLHRPLYQPDIDKVVLGIKSKYGIRVFTYYSRGSLRGHVRLNVKAERTSKWVSGISADNFGSESTGRDRVTATFNSFDLMGSLDVLTVGVQEAVDGESSTNGFIQYELPVDSLDHTLSFSASNNQFEIGEGFEALGLEGDAALFGLSYQYQLRNTFTDQIRVGLSMDYKRNDYGSLLDDPLIEQDEVSKSVSLFSSYHYRPIASSWSYGVYFSITTGDYEFENTNFDASFTKAYFNQQVQLGLGEPGSLFFASMKLSISGQYAQERLASFELLSMSGAYGIRNVETGYFGADRGLISNLEWWFPNLLPEFWAIRSAPFVYYDAGYGERLDEEDTYGTGVILGGSGVGLQVKYKQQFVLSASTSLSLHEHTSDNPDPERMKFLIKLNYLFK